VIGESNLASERKIPTASSHAVEPARPHRSFEGDCALISVRFAPGLQAAHATTDDFFESGTKERDSEVEGKAVRVAASELGRRASFKPGSEKWSARARDIKGKATKAAASDVGSRASLNQTCLFMISSFLIDKSHPCHLRNPWVDDLVLNK
jgi:hypothetical protein